MKKLLIIFMPIILTGCTIASVNDSLFAYFKDYSRQREEGDTLIQIESTQKQKALWVYADVYLDIYEGCTSGKKEEGYLGAAKVSSNPKIGLTRDVYVPSNKELYFSYGEYHSETSCGSNFKLATKPETVYKFVYSFKPFKGCNVQAFEKISGSNEFEPSQNVQFLKGSDSFNSYRKVHFRKCEE